MALQDPKVRIARGKDVSMQIAGGAFAEPKTLYEESWRDFVFAEVWARPGLDRRSRFWIAMSGAAITGGETEDLDRYVRGALTSGDATLEELREASLQLSIYAGWTPGGALDRTVTRVAADMGLDRTNYPPIRANEWDSEVRLQEGHDYFDKVMTFPPGPPSTPYNTAIKNFVFGEMWCRPGLDQRARRWITLVGVSESDASHTIRTHLFAAVRSGDCTPDELYEYILQYGTHAGWPKASNIQIMLDDIIDRLAKGLSWND